MPGFDQEDADMEVPAFINFEKKGLGSFQFILVRGELDARFEEAEGKPCVKFAWIGMDELDEVSGRGEAYVDETGNKMEGTIYLFQGGDYRFRASKEKKK